MSKLNGTVTSTPEEKWGLMADMVDNEPEEISATVDTGERQSAPAVSVEKAKPEMADAEKKDAEKKDTGTKDAEVSGTTGRSRRNRVAARRIAVGALVVFAVAAVIVAAILGWKLHEQSNIDAAADDARTAAEQYAVTLTSVSSDSLDQNFAAVLDGATGEFKDMYSQSSGQLRDLLVENKANAQGTVIDSAIKAATTSKVEVMLFVDQSVTNTATPDARIDRSRVLMTMEKIDGRWLASKVDLP